SKGSHQADNARGEVSRRAPLQHQRAQNLVLSEQRHHQQRMKSGRKREISEGVIGCVGEIRYADWLALLRGDAHDTVVGPDQDGAYGILIRRVERTGLGQLEDVSRLVVAVIALASTLVSSTARVTIVASTDLVSREEATARPISSSAFNSLTDRARSRVRSATFCSSALYDPCSWSAM